MATEQPVKIRRGDDVTLSGIVTDEDAATVDISSDSMLFTVKNNLADLDAAKVFQVAATSLTAGGAFDIVITDVDTISLDLRTRWYDLELTTAAGAKASVSRGRFILTGEVTKA